MTKARISERRTRSPQHRLPTPLGLADHGTATLHGDTNALHVMQVSKGFEEPGLAKGRAPHVRPR